MSSFILSPISGAHAALCSIGVLRFEGLTKWKADCSLTEMDETDELVDDSQHVFPDLPTVWLSYHDKLNCVFFKTRLVKRHVVVGGFSTPI